MKFENSATITGRYSQKLTLSTNAASTGPLDPGNYAVWSDVDCYLTVQKDATSAEEVTIESGDNPGLKITADNPAFILRLADMLHIGGIAGGNGTLYYIKIT